MTKMVDVSGTLTVSGTKDATPLHILTAFAGTKHFSVGNNKILKLFYLKLTGGKADIKTIRSCKTFDGSRKKWNGKHVEMAASGVAYGEATTWAACKAACQDEFLCAQVVWSGTNCYPMSEANDDNESPTYARFTDGVDCSVKAGWSLIKTKQECLDAAAKALAAGERSSFAVGQEGDLNNQASVEWPTGCYDYQKASHAGALYLNLGVVGVTKPYNDQNWPRAQYCKQDNTVWKSAACSNAFKSYCGGSIGLVHPQGAGVVGGLLEATNVHWVLNEAHIGGALCVENGKAIIKDSIFQENNADDNGGALFISLDGDVSLENTIVQDNVAGRNGGAVYIDGVGVNTIFKTPGSATGSVVHTIPSVSLPSKFVIKATITTGTPSSNDDGIVMFGNSGQCGNLYVLLKKASWSLFKCYNGVGGTCFEHSMTDFPVGDWKAPAYTNDYAGYQAYCSSWGANGGVFNGGHGPCDTSSSTGKFSFGVQCSTAILESQTVVAPNTEYDLIYTYDGTTATIMVNGVLDVSAAKTFIYPTTITKVNLGSGKIGDSATESFDFGVISSVHIYNSITTGDKGGELKLIAGNNRFQNNQITPTTGSSEKYYHITRRADKIDYIANLVICSSASQKHVGGGDTKAALNLNGCAAACIADAGCNFFISGVAAKSKEGYCYLEITTSEECPSFEVDNYNFYGLRSSLVVGRQIFRTKKGKQLKATICPPDRFQRKNSLASAFQYNDDFFGCPFTCSVSGKTRSGGESIAVENSVKPQSFFCENILNKGW